MVLSFEVPGNPELSVHLSVLKQDTSHHLHSSLGQPLWSPYLLRAQVSEGLILRKLPGPWLIWVSLDTQYPGLCLGDSSIPCGTPAVRDCSPSLPLYSSNPLDPGPTPIPFSNNCDSRFLSIHTPACSRAGISMKWGRQQAGC